MIPANTEVLCPACDEDFTIEHDVFERENTKCTHCDVLLELVNGDLKVVDEDIYDEEDYSDVDPNEGIK